MQSPYKKLKNIVNEIITKKKISKTINDYDNSVNLNSTFRGYSIHKKVNEIDFDYRSYFDHSFDKYGMQICRNIDEKIAHLAAKNINFFKEDILFFIGTDTRLDDMYMSLYSQKDARYFGTSGAWHRDNCGHRLKLFVCIEGDGKMPTIIVPDSNREKYKFSIREILRLFNINSKKSYNNSLNISYSTGDAALFDTQLLHRGSYEKSKSIRCVLILEFINKYKSNSIADFTPCGPGGSKNGEINFKENVFKILNNTGLIDNEIVKEINGNYIYSIKNLEV